MRLIFALLLAAGLGAPAFAADTNAGGAPETAANGFYGVYKSLGLSDGIPDARARTRYAPFLSPALDTLLAAAGAAETKFQAANKDAPPLIEGDLFTALFEGATSFKVGACSGDDAHAHCAVALEYDAPHEKPQTWTDTILLLNTPKGWRVDDIAYGGNWDFANKGRLTETLKTVLAEAR